MKKISTRFVFVADEKERKRENCGQWEISCLRTLLCVCAWIYVAAYFVKENNNDQWVRN